MKAEELKPQELRFGNYIKSKESGFNHIVLGIEDKRVSLDKSKYPYDFLRDCEPVPLTEEWLLRFGFEKDRYNFIINFGFDFCVEYYYADNIYSFWIYTDDDWHCILNEIKYVHSLQNLIYALTGQELTLNEEI